MSREKKWLGPIFVSGGVRSKVWGSLSFERTAIFLFLLMKNKVDNTLALFFLAEIYSRQKYIYVLKLVPSHNN
ncbi:hypothetical protein [Bacillus paramycoides]|uniref:hypothetical protein n=1 Tax=Bacillus paramycoides TaxID=2026194 RepID=UPI002E200668|nr:hypothetical protein [Bacillus paramycoides]